jgi:PAS domain-containing protein
MAYLDDLTPDYQVEIPIENLETMRRLLYMYKKAIDNLPLAMFDHTANEAIAISSEFEDLFGWTLEEFQALPMDEFWHEDSYEIAETNRQHSLSAPFMARCYGKSGQNAYFKVDALNMAFDGEQWRMYSFELIP